MGTPERGGSPGRLSRDHEQLTGSVGQAARERARLHAAEQAVASEVIEFQLARQRAGLVGPESVEPLSPREREVIALLAAGRSDGEIAAALFISKKTASVHVANIKAKLGAGSRVEIALLASRLGLTEIDAAHHLDDVSAQSRTTVVCPFKGLAAYDAADAPYFFGREALVAALVAKLVGAGLVGVVGPSGSGKSSILRAGLLPALAEGVLPGSDRWTVGVMRPGSTPSAELAAAVAAALRRVGSDPTGIEDPAAALDRLPEGSRLVIVADQLEELFTVCGDEAERLAFVGQLGRLAGDPGGRATVVVAIRADAYGSCAAYPGLGRALAANHLLVGPMTTDELTRAVELPARAAGLRVEPALTGALVAAVAGEPGALPMLSTTLLELWQRRDGRTIRLEAYERIGGVSGAVARLAEVAYRRLTADQQQGARSLLLRLVAVADDGTVARRPLRPNAFDGAMDADLAAVLATLTESRIIAVDEARIEIAHEALLRDWPRLQGWIDDDAGDRAIREHLARATADWDTAGRPAGELYRGARLAGAIDWLAAHERDLTATERAFLDASRQAAGREIAVERRTNRRLRTLLGAVVALLVLAIVGALVAAGQAGRADRNAAAARVRELTASAVAVLEEDPALAKLLLVSAFPEAPGGLPVETMSALHAAMANDAVTWRHAWPEAQRPGPAAWTDLDPTGSRLVASSTAEEPGRSLEMVDVRRGETVWQFTPVPAGALVGPAFFTADGGRVIAATTWVEAAPPPRTGLGLQQLDAATGEVVAITPLGDCGGAVTGLAGELALVRYLDGDGATAACSGFERGAQVAIGIVDLRTGALRVVAERAAGGGEAISGDGRRVAFNDASGSPQVTVVVDLASGERLVEIDAFEHNTWPRSLNHDGSLLLAGDRPILVFDVDAGGGDPAARFAGHAGDSFHAEFAETGDIAWSTGRDATLRRWHARTGAELAVFGAVGSGRPSVAGDGRTVLVADIETGSLAMVDSGPWGELGTIETCAGQNVAATLAVDRSVAALLQVCDDDATFLGTLRIVDLATGKIRHSISGIEGQLLRFSPDGTRIVHQSSAIRVEGRFPWAGPLVVIDASSGDRVLELDGLCSWDWEQVDAVGRNAAGECRAFPKPPFPMWLLGLRWSPDGSMIFAADNHNMDGYFGVWDATTGALLHAGPAAAGKAFDAAFTLDSRELIVARYDTGRLERLSTTTWEVVQTVDLASSLPGGDRLWFAGWSPDGSALLAVGGFLGAGGGSLVWLDAETLLPARAVEGAHDGSPKAVAVSPSGRLVATAASGDPVKVWEMATGTLVHEVPVGRTQVQGVAFVDEDTLLVAPDGGDLLLMTLDPDALLEAARASLTRGFTSAECMRFEFGADCPTLAELRGG